MQNIDLITKNIKIPTAVVGADNELSLSGAHEAHKLGLIDPILIGNKCKIKAYCDINNWSPDRSIIIADDEKTASKNACELASRNEVKLIVKGHVHTDVLMSEFVKKSYSLREKGSKLSHIWYLSFKDDDIHPIIITDGALNINPSLETKKHILKNVINFVDKIPTFDQKIAILSATEENLPQMQSSVDAAEIASWANTEFKNYDIFGPLAFDNAISLDAAKIKGIQNSVAGRANVFLVPNIETGNAIVKVCVNLMGATAGGFIVGGKIPVVITSRSDDLKSRLSSIINAILSLN